MKLAPEVSVVVCAYTEDRWDDISRALSSIGQQTRPPLETILVADHNEALRARIADAFPAVRTVPNAGQRGLSDARNSGVAASRGAVVAFLDDDAVADPAWLETLAEAYRDPAVIGVGGAASPNWDTGRPAWFPEEFDWVVGCSYRGLPVVPAPIRNPLGCNMSFRREAFDVGGFDTSVGRVGIWPAGGEETEFCIRLRKRLPGRLLIYHPGALVRHRVRAERTTWRYFRERCYAEGLSKARITVLVGSGGGLASERRHTAVTLPAAVVRHLASTRRAGTSGPLRAGVVVVGLMITIAGFLRGRARLWRAGEAHPPAPSADPAP